MQGFISEGKADGHVKPQLLLQHLQKPPVVEVAQATQVAPSTASQCVGRLLEEETWQGRFSRGRGKRLSAPDYRLYLRGSPGIIHKVED